MKGGGGGMRLMGKINNKEEGNRGAKKEKDEISKMK